MPEALEERYRALIDTDFIASSSLKVPIMRQQAGWLWAANRLERRSLGKAFYVVAKLPYSTERGLDLKFRDDDA